MSTAYKIASDISDTARSLWEKQIFDPFHIEIEWFDANENYEIIIGVSIRRKEAKNESNPKNTT